MGEEDILLTQWFRVGYLTPGVNSWPCSCVSYMLSLERLWYGRGKGAVGIYYLIFFIGRNRAPDQAKEMSS